MPYRHYLWIIARLAVAIIVVGWAYTYLAPSGGDQEFVRMAAALKNVNTVHYELVADPAPGYHIDDSGDIDCTGDAFRRRYAESAGAKSRTTDFKRIDHTEYMLQDSGLWNTGDSGVPPYHTGREACNLFREPRATWFAPDFDRIVKHSVISKGDKKKLADGETCREWKATFLVGQPGTPGASQHRTVCIGINDHLPREVRNDEAKTFITYAFNQPTTIEAPTEAEMVPEDQRKPQLGQIGPGSLYGK